MDLPEAILKSQVESILAMKILWISFLFSTSYITISALIGTLQKVVQAFSSVNIILSALFTIYRGFTTRMVYLKHDI